jgi:prolipoprotein diacylglyceryl transferase
MQGFYLGPFYLYTWGLTAAIGVLAAVWLVGRKLTRKAKITENQFWNLAILLVIAAFAGARISAVLEYWNYYSTDSWAVFRLWEGGFSFFGGAVGAVLTGYIWCKKNKVSYLYIGRLFTPAWLVGLFFGRIGCFLIHDHLGKPTTLPWGIYVQGCYRHEPALYEMIMILLIIGILHFYRKKIGKFLFPISLILYSFGRFFLDFTRADDPLYYSLTVAQWLCIFVFLWSIILIKKQNSR